ncbi:MAG TPA: cadherin-like beta sandwich domain-containing protein, partial [Spirochaetota bacterium]|nr:cadherin-like beta sandwich domain-containing protein [Spirochaetota bacterium]
MNNKNFFTAIFLLLSFFMFLFFFGISCSNPEVITPNVEPPTPSDNAYLKSIEILNGIKLLPTFKKTTIDYAFEASDDARSISCIIFPEDNNASIIVNGVKIKNGEKTNVYIGTDSFIMINVTAQNNSSTMDYYIKILRKSPVTTTTLALTTTTVKGDLTGDANQTTTTINDNSNDITTSTVTTLGNGSGTTINNGVVTTNGNGVVTTLSNVTTTTTQNPVTTTVSNSATTVTTLGNVATTTTASNQSTTTTLGNGSTTTLPSTTLPSTTLGTSTTSTSSSTTTTTTVIATTTTTSTTTTTIPYDGVIIYYKAATAPKIWGWETSGLESVKLMGYTWAAQPTMVSSEYSGWFKFEIPATKDGVQILSGKNLVFMFNSGSETPRNSNKTGWYDSSTNTWTDYFPD